VNRRQWTILIVAWLGWVFDIMDTALFNFAKGPMLKEMMGEAAYRVSGAAVEGRIQMLFLVGWSIGGLVFGILADRWGRGKTLVVTILLYSALTGLTALCQTPDQVMWLRFFTAFGIGGEWAAGAALVAETVPADWRARASSYLQSAAAFGPWLAALANISVPAGNWRALFILGAAPALLCVFIRMRVPEGPAPARVPPNLRLVFQDKALMRNLAVACGLGIVGVTGAGILPFWLPNLVDQAGKLLGEEAKRDFLSLNTFTLHIGTLAGVFVFPWLAQRFGRRPLFAIFFVMAPTMTALALAQGPNLDRLLYLLPLASFFSVGVSSGFVLYFPELFPSWFRATGSGVAYNAGRIVSAPIPAMVGIIIAQRGGDVIPGVLIASAIYAFGLIALVFAPETKGKPLPA